MIFNNSLGLAQISSRFGLDFIILNDSLIVKIGSMPVSAILPAKIEIKALVSVFIKSITFVTWAIVMTAVTFKITPLLERFSITDVVSWPLELVIGIFILIYKSKLTSRFYILNLNLFSIIIFCSLPGLLLFLIAVDTGRWTSMLYHMIAISFFGMIKLGYVKLDSNIKYKYINFNKLKNNFLFYFLIFILCFGWSPKAVYH